MPFCGPNPGLRTRWLAGAKRAASPRHPGPAAAALGRLTARQAFGLLVLGSPIRSGLIPMGTDFLSRMAELASASLRCSLLPFGAIASLIGVSATAPCLKRPPPTLDPGRLAIWNMCASKSGWPRARSTADLEKLAQFQAGVNVPLLQLQTAHIPPLLWRRCTAAGAAGGVHRAHPLGLARLLHLGWAAGADSAQPGAGRARPGRPPLPKALGVDDAVRLAGFDNTRRRPRLEARDAAMVELLYGCGLRVGELAGLDAIPNADTQRQGRGWWNRKRARPMCSRQGTSAAACRWAPRLRTAGWFATAEATPLVARALRGWTPCSVGQRGKRLTASRSGWPAPAQPAGGSDTSAPAHAAPLVCQPSAAKQRRPTRAGAAGPRQHPDHAGLRDSVGTWPRCMTRRIRAKTES